jgi:hypothetical protein
MLSPLQCLQAGYATSLACHSVGSRARVWRLGPEANFLSLSSADSKSDWSYNPLLHTHSWGEQGHILRYI